MSMKIVSIGAEKLKFDSEGNFYVDRVINKNGETKRFELSELSPPLLKEVEFSVIIKRSWTTAQGEDRTFLGLQKMVARVPSDSQYRYTFLSYVPKIMQSICVS